MPTRDLAINVVIDAVGAHYRKRLVTAEPRSNSIELRAAPTTNIPEQNYRMYKQSARAG